MKNFWCWLLNHAVRSSTHEEWKETLMNFRCMRCNRGFMHTSEIKRFEK